MTTRTVSKNRAIVFLTAQLFFAFALAVAFHPSAWAGPDEDLFKAAFAGDVSAVRAALAHGADVNRSDTDGDTPLWEAAYWGHAEVAKLLLAAGADVNRANTGGDTPLWEAAYNGHAKVVKLLLAAGADVNRADTGGDTPLWMAAYIGHAEVVKLLLAAGAKPTQGALYAAKGESKTLIQEALNAAPPSSFSPPVVAQTDSPPAPSVSPAPQSSASPGQNETPPPPVSPSPVQNLSEIKKMLSNLQA